MRQVIRTLVLTTALLAASTVAFTHHSVSGQFDTTKKVTITLEAEQLEAIRGLVGAGSTKSVSAFVQHAVAVSLSDVAGWGALLAAALEQTGGPMTKAERAWADGVLSSPGRRRKRARRRAA